MLPILTFEQGRLNPSHGYFFDRRWLAPQETIVSIAWKFARMNALPGHIVARQFARDDADPYEGIAATALEAAVPALARALGIPRRALQDGTGPLHGYRSMHAWLRFCTKCMRLGYHGVMHQRAGASRCPCHGAALEESCRSCGFCAEYRLNAKLLGAPFRCSNCRRPYSGFGIVGAPRQPPADVRRAITRWRYGA